MTKKNITETLRHEFALTPKEADAIFNRVISSIIDIPVGEKLELRGFGTFVRKQVSPINRRNPATGEKVPSVSYSTIRFSPSKLLRDYVS